MKSFVNNVLPVFLAFLFFSATLPAQAQANPPVNAPGSELPSNARQDLGALGPVIEHFVEVQSVGTQNRITVELGRIDPRLNLAACPSPEAFLPNGSRAFGKTMVGVRCAAPVAWSIYVPVTVRVYGDYYVTAGALTRGQVVEAQDLAKANGDLTMLPKSIITDPTQAIGRTVSMAMRPGTPLRQDELRSQLVIRQGQTVKVVSNGPGFQVSADAVATSNAVEGQIGQAKTSNGQTVSGIAKSGGILEVNN
ncbi:MAG TPA: flagellar basal body P-ring formation chaperone FlgA [Herbaspirillum sp.]|jgi:flagella basal body P-ring formation protein FlgA